MTEILSSNEDQDQVVVRSKAAGLLGLIELGRGRLERASRWLSKAASQSSVRLETPWGRFLASAISASKARLATEDVVGQIANTKLELEDEIQLLENEVARLSADVYFSIKGIIPRIEEPEEAYPGVAQPAQAASGVVDVRMLGRFQARHNGHSPIQLCSNRKGQSIFMILVSRPGNLIHKESLLELLWPRENPNVSAGKLHTAVSRLRRSLRESALGNESLLFEDDYYFVSPVFEFISDVDRFELQVDEGIRLETEQNQEAAIAGFEKARSLYGGPYLDDLRGEEWPIAERLRLENRYLEVLARLANLYFSNADLSSCIRCCEELIAHDNLREDAHRLLMQSHYIKGNRIQAIRGYRELEAALRTELGIEPDRETRMLFEKIRRP
jgi:DNA-binding SARP family transcriptional activator